MSMSEIQNAFLQSIKLLEQERANAEQARGHIEQAEMPFSTQIDVQAQALKHYEEIKEKISGIQGHLAALVGLLDAGMAASAQAEELGKLAEEPARSAMSNVLSAVKPIHAAYGDITRSQWAENVAGKSSLASGEVLGLSMTIAAFGGAFHAGFTEATDKNQEARTLLGSLEEVIGSASEGMADPASRITAPFLTYWPPERVHERARTKATAAVTKIDNAITLFETQANLLEDQ
jgi:hypothetical protein